MLDPEFDPSAHVAAAAPMVGLRLDAARQAKVAAALAQVIRTAAPALAMALALAPSDEPAPVFRP